MCLAVAQNWQLSSDTCYHLTTRETIDLLSGSYSVQVGLFSVCYGLIMCRGDVLNKDGAITINKPTADISFPLRLCWICSILIEDFVILLGVWYMVWEECYCTQKESHEPCWLLLPRDSVCHGNHRQANLQRSSIPLESNWCHHGRGFWWGIAL